MYNARIHKLTHSLLNKYSYTNTYTLLHILTQTRTVKNKKKIKLNQKNNKKTGK